MASFCVVPASISALTNARMYRFSSTRRCVRFFAATSVPPWAAFFFTSSLRVSALWSLSFYLTISLNSTIRLFLYFVPTFF
jgi:hypothetical protein